MIVERHWTRLSTWLVAFMGAYMLVNMVRATMDPAGFAAYMGLPLKDPTDHAFVQVYALRAAYLGLCALGLVWLREIRALFVFALVATLMPVGDTILTASASAPPLVVTRHAATAIVLALTSLLLFNRAFREGKS